MVVEVVAETVGIVAVDRIRQNDEARKLIVADRNHEDVGVEGHDRHALHITFQFIDEEVLTFLFPVHLHREGVVLLQPEGINRKHSRAADQRHIVDTQLAIVGNVGDQSRLVVVRTLEIDGIGHIDHAVLVVLCIDKGIQGIVSTLDEAPFVLRIRIQGDHRTLQIIKCEVVDGIMQQTVTDGVRITVAVGVELDDLDTHGVVAGLTLLAHKVDVQSVVVEHIQQIGAQMRLRNTAFGLSNEALAVIGHGEVAIVGHIGHSLVISVTILLGKLIIDVNRAGVLMILVAAGIHLHTDMVFDIGTHVQHIRDQLALRKDGILDVENGGVMGKEGDHTDFRMVGEVADKAVRTHRRVVVLPEVIDDTVETGLLEPDVHPCAGIQRTQTDQSVFKGIFHREPAGPSVQRVIFRNDNTGRRVQFRNNNHVTMVVKHLADGVPIDAVG